MSAPILACNLVDAIAPLMQSLTETMNGNTRVDWFPKSDHCHSFWSVSIHDHGQCFSGNDDTSPSRALMNANADRQRWEESVARGRVLIARDVEMAA